MDTREGGGGGHSKRPGRRRGRGVMIATKENVTIEPVSIDPKCESAWGKIYIKEKSDLYIRCFYRRPNEYTPTRVEDLEQDLRDIEALTRNNNRASMILGGDFNACDIDWNTHTVEPESTIKPLCEKVMSVFAEFNLGQLQSPLGEKCIGLHMYKQTRFSKIDPHHTRYIWPRGHCFWQRPQCQTYQERA